MRGDDCALEVIATVGGPPGDHTSEGGVYIRTYTEALQVWVADDASLDVTFGPDGRVDYVRVDERRNRSWWEEWLDRLGL